MTDQPKPAPENVSDSAEQKVTPSKPPIIEDTRTKIAGVVLWPPHTATELSSDERTQLIAFGDRAMHQNLLSGALEAYIAADDKEKLFVLAELCNSKQRYDLAQDAIHAGGGADLFNRWHYSGSPKSYSDAALSFGNTYLHEDRLSKAINAYAAAGAAGKGELIALGDRFSEKNPSLALDAYRAAGAKDKLVLLGDRCLQSDFAKARFKIAFQAYAAAAGKEIAEEKLTAWGDRRLEEGNFYDARHAYAEAGQRISEDKLIAQADRLLQEGDISFAEAAYAEVGQEIPKEKRDAFRKTHKKLAEYHEANKGFVRRPPPPPLRDRRRDDDARTIG